MNIGHIIFKRKNNREFTTLILRLICGDYAFMLSFKFFISIENVQSDFIKKKKPGTYDNDMMKVIDKKI